MSPTSEDDPTKGGRPHLIVTVDTEEEGLWSGKYRRTGNTAENVCAVKPFQELCDRLGIRPTYLVDAPVVQDHRAVELLRGFQESGRAEVGAHVHPWCNPPLIEEINDRNSFLCNLPESLQREKVIWLTDSIEERFGQRPTSFRAGRYGLDGRGAKILAELGYRVDSSVIPFTDFSSSSGPNYDRAPHQPYFVGEDLCDRVESGSLLEVPISVGYSRNNFARAHLIRRFAMRPFPRRMRCVGIVDRLGLARRIKLSPEQSDDREMVTLINAYLNQQASCLVMMFHSSSLVPGYSPYVTNCSALEEFYQRIKRVFEYCMSDLKLLSSSLTEFACEFTGHKGNYLHPLHAGWARSDTG